MLTEGNSIARQEGIMKKARAAIRDLQIWAIIGTNDWEREEKQELIVNMEFEFDAEKAAFSDDLWDTVDYKSMKKRVIDFVEKSQFQLLEKLTAEVLRMVLDEPLVLAATVRIDKPHALRYAKSVSIEMSDSRPDPAV